VELTVNAGLRRDATIRADFTSRYHGDGFSTAVTGAVDMRLVPLPKPPAVRWPDFTFPVDEQVFVAATAAAATSAYVRSGGRISPQMAGIYGTGLR